MERDILEIIAERLCSFSKGRQQIATYILKNPNEASFQTAAVIGKAVGVSESSVVRFAGDLGFKGFPEFQKALQKVAMDQLRDHHRSQDREDIHSNPFPPPLTDAVSELQQCRRLWFLSDSLGSVLFPYCKLWCNLAGEPITDLSSERSESLFRSLSLIEPGDLLLVPVFCEISPILLFAIEQGKTLGARIIALTNIQESPVTALADILLPIQLQGGTMIPDLAPAVTMLCAILSQWCSTRKHHIAKQMRIYKEIRNAYENRKF